MLSDRRSGPGLVDAAVVTRLATGESPGAIRGGFGGHVGSFGILPVLRGEGREGAGGVPSSDDGAVVDLWLLHRSGQLAADREADVRGCGVSVPECGFPSGSQHGERVSEAAFGSTGGTVPASAAIVPEGGAGETGACGGGREQGAGEREQTQGDELRSDV